MMTSSHHACRIFRDRADMAPKVGIFDTLSPRLLAADLLLITPGFPASEEDSTCIPPLQEYLLALRRARPALRIAVVATQYPATRRPYTWHGIQVVPCGGGNRKWLKPLTMLRARAAARQVTRSGRPHAVHSLWLGEAAWLGQRLAIEFGARHLITLMGQDARDGRAWWERLRRGSTMVAVSERQAKVYIATFNEALQDVIPWGLAETAHDALPHRAIDLLFCGSLSQVKRPLLFVETVARVNAGRPVKAMIIGDGPFRQSVQRAITYHMLDGVITMRGELPRAEALRAMRSARVLLHTSGFESQGFVFDEALAHGMSIVSGAVGSAVPSERWYVTDDDGLAEAALDQLAATPGRGALLLHDVRDTVRSYLRLYGIA